MSLPVSVIIPTYNRAKMIARAVASALAMTLAGDEVIVVDDNSTDNTEAVLSPWRDKIRFVRLNHGGAGAARNAGIRLASKPLVAFLDSDDEWCGHKLALQRALMTARPDVLFCFSDFSVHDEDGQEHHRYLNEHWHSKPIPWQIALGPGIALSALAPLPEGAADCSVHIGSLYLAQMEAPYVLTSTLMVRREQAGDALHFAEDLPTLEDCACFATLAQAGPAAYLDCELARQWSHRQGRLSEMDEFIHAGARLTILERVWGSDREFIGRYGDRYRRRCRSQHLLRARWLLCRGRTHEAQAELDAAGGSPRAYRVLSALPGPITWSLLSVRSLLRQPLHRHHDGRTVA